MSNDYVERPLCRDYCVSMFIVELLRQFIGGAIQWAAGSMGRGNATSHMAGGPINQSVGISGTTVD